MVLKNIRLILFVLSASWLAASCASAPYTGRRQLLMGSESGEISSGLQAYNSLRRQYRACSDPAINELAFRVGSRIAAAANRPDYRWEFVVLANDKEANAFCLPGGKVGIFTGILKYTKDETGLATVIAHEAAHALARHAGERQSQAMLAQLGGLGLGLGLGGVGGIAGQAISQGYGLGTQLGILLPYNRKQEMEADKIGLILMAKAGYDPALALDFWRRMMAKDDKKLQAPQFMSTHPHDYTRIQAMAEFLPEAKKHYVAPVALAEPAPGLTAPPAGFAAPPPMPERPPLQRPPGSKIPEGAPAPTPAPPKPAPAPSPEFEHESKELELKRMDNSGRTAPLPSGQWMPKSKL